MKIILLILIVFPSVYFAQESKEKNSTPPIRPSTTDCPTWNKKSKKNSKAAYFEYLRSPKTKKDQQTNFNSAQKKPPEEIVKKTENTSKKKYLIQSRKPNDQALAQPDKKSLKKKTASESGKTELISTAKKEEKKAEANVSKVPPTVSQQVFTENKAEKSDKDKTGDDKLKRKLKLMARKTTKIHKHSNAKCPSF